MIPASILVEGLIVGFTIVLMASGLILVLSIMNILNFAHGQFYMLGAFALWYFNVQIGLQYFPALLISIILTAFIGVLIERFLFRPLSDQGFLATSVVALGLVLFFEGILTIFFGPGFKSVPTVLQGMFKLGPIFLSNERLMLVSISVVSLIGLALFINKTKIGLAIRAAAQEPMVASLYGVPSGKLFTVVMAVGVALAALAGTLAAPIYFVDPFIGTKPLNLSLLAIVLGGLGSFAGAFVGGMILGMMSTVVAYYIGAWYELIAFLLIILMIIFRPQGLFGKVQREA